MSPPFSTLETNTERLAQSKILYIGGNNGSTFSRLAHPRTAKVNGSKNFKLYDITTHNDRLKKLTSSRVFQSPRVYQFSNIPN